MRARSGCERCGRWCGEGSWAEYHHRTPRGMGGTSGDRAEALSSAANCLLLCSQCHRWVELNRDESFTSGWLVPWSGDPAEVAVVVFELGPVLLGVNGRYLRAGADLPTLAPRPGRVATRWR